MLVYPDGSEGAIELPSLNAKIRIKSPAWWAGRVTVVAAAVAEPMYLIADSAISITAVVHGPEVPPTETFVLLQLVTPPFVSAPAASSVASDTVLRFVISDGAVSRLISDWLQPAKPSTQDDPLVLFSVSAG